MPSLLDLSTELQELIVGYLDSPTIVRDVPAKYFAPRTSRDLARLSSCCHSLHSLVGPRLHRKVCLQNNDKSGKSLQAIGSDTWAASFVRELSVEANIILDDEWKEPNPLSAEDFPSSVQDVLSHLERFPNLEVLSVQFKCDETEELDEWAVESNFNIWSYTPDPFRNFTELKQKEEWSDWKALMARTYDAISGSPRPSTLKTLELRNLLPTGVSSFTTEAWQAFLRSLEVLRVSLHGCDNDFNLAWGFIGFVENLDMLFSHLVNVTEFRFEGSEHGWPGGRGHLHTTIPLDVQDMPMLQVFELRHCFISERTARFIAGHVKTLKRVTLEDCYSVATCSSADEQTTWATFFNIIANSLDEDKNPCLEDFFVSPRSLSESGNGARTLGVPVVGDEQQIELANSMAKISPYRRPFNYGWMDDKYAYLREDEEQNLAAFLAGHDQAAYDRVMAIAGRRPGSRQSSV